MYKYKKLRGEKIKYISDDALVKMGKEFKQVTIILTDKRLLFLDYPSAVNNFEEALRTGRNVNYLKQKEPILIIDLKDLDHIETEEIDKYVLKNGKFFSIQEDELRRKIID